MFERETANLKAAGIPTPLADLIEKSTTDTLARSICRTAADVTRIERSLVDLGEQIKDRINQVSAWFTGDTVSRYGFNGDLRSDGPRYDATCAELAATRHALALLGELWNERNATELAELREQLNTPR